MAYNPCSLCGERFVGSAVTGYHSWFIGGWRKAYKQKLCPKCARLHYADVVSVSVNTQDEDPQWPDHCPGCQDQLEGDVAQTWTTWYRGKTRQDLVLIQCEHCAANTRTQMIQGAEALEDRERVGVGERGAPLPNPPGFGRGDNLPW